MQDQSSEKVAPSTRFLSGCSRTRLLLVWLLVAVVCLGVPVGTLAGSTGATHVSPLAIGTAQAQTATTSDANDSAANASGGSVTLTNQSTPTGQNVTVANATLPKGGFIGIHGDGYSYGQIELSLITTSRYLEPGSYQNLTIPVDNGVPGGYGNTSQFNGTQNITARLYTDSNSNQHFDYLLSSDSDKSYRSGEEPVADSAELVIEGARGSPSWTIPKASIAFGEQTTNGRTVVVDQARLPDGGFLVVHDSSYLPPENESFNSTIGVSSYLQPNETVSDVPIELFNVPGRSMGNQTALANNTTLVVQASRDTNGDQSYDYIRSEGVEDQPYTNNSEIVEERADVPINKSADVERTERSQANETGQPVDVNIGPNVGFLGKLTAFFDGMWVNAFAGAMFVLFAAVFVRRRIRG
jgi:hypothetical protein